MSTKRDVGHPSRPSPDRSVGAPGPSGPQSTGAYQPSEAEIKAKAYELYLRSGSVPGHDCENWLEAEAYLIANPPHASERSASFQAAEEVPRRHALPRRHRN